jgi:hypothetical protein
MGGREVFVDTSGYTYPCSNRSSFVLMRELQLRQALTIDEQIHEAGFEPVLPPASRAR